MFRIKITTLCLFVFWCRDAGLTGDTSISLTGDASIGKQRAHARLAFW